MKNINYDGPIFDCTIRGLRTKDEFTIGVYAKDIRQARIKAISMFQTIPRKIVRRK